MKTGHNIHLTRLEIEQAIREKALQLAKARRVVVDSIDSLDFQNKAVVHYTIATVPGPLGPDGQPTPMPVVTDVQIVWED